MDPGLPALTLMWCPLDPHRKHVIVSGHERVPWSSSLPHVKHWDSERADVQNTVTRAGRKNRESFTRFFILGRSPGRVHTCVWSVHSLHTSDRAEEGRPP